MPLIFGSDTPGVDGFGNPTGAEWEGLSCKTGPTPVLHLALILRAAMLDNAIALGLSHELGSIEVGKRADLLLLEENPAYERQRYDSIETIFLNGEPIAREELRAHD